MQQLGFLDFDIRLDRINNAGDPLLQLEKAIESLKEQGYREHLQCKESRNRKLTKWQQQGNRTRSIIRSGVEHISGIQAQRAGNLYFAWHRHCSNWSENRLA